MEFNLFKRKEKNNIIVQMQEEKIEALNELVKTYREKDQITSKLIENYKIKISQKDALINHKEKIIIENKNKCSEKSKYINILQEKIIRQDVTIQSLKTQNKIMDKLVKTYNKKL